MYHMYHIVSTCQKLAFILLLHLCSCTGPGLQQMRLGNWIQVREGRGLMHCEARGELAELRDMWV